jgi:hypothetical protein
VQRGMLRDVYGYVRQKLAANDTASASLALQTDIRSQFQSVWSALGSTKLPAAAQAMGIIADGALLGSTAQSDWSPYHAGQTRAEVLPSSGR